MKVALIIPTYKAESEIDRLMQSILAQELQPVEILVINTRSGDQTVDLLKKYPVRVHEIDQCEFNHGATRHLAFSMVDADIYIFMTQDAYFADKHAISQLIEPYKDERVACVYARQLPHKNASVLAAHARSFNYPEKSDVRSLSDASKYGVKTFFNSNSCSSYRKTAYFEAGGVPADLILGEDAYMAGCLLRDGYKVAYASGSCVYHSHNYSIKQEFKRYFDIGVFHCDQHWLIETFGAATGEGRRYVLSEWCYCLKKGAIFSLLRSFLVVGAKLVAYRLGLKYKKLPSWLCKKLSMHAYHWHS